MSCILWFLLLDTPEHEGSAVHLRGEEGWKCGSREARWRPAEDLLAFERCLRSTLQT